MKLYRLLLRLYPRAFRDRFAVEMIALFTDAHASADRSWRGRLAFWRVIAGDVARSAARERFPTDRSFSMAEFGYDMRQAWRAVSRAPALAAFAVLLMALGIGSTTAVFSVVNAVLLRPFPFGDPERIVMVWERQSAENPRNIVAGHEFPEWRARARSFAHMAAIAFDREYDLTGAGEPLKLVAARITSEFFPVMGVAPRLGRPFTADDDRPGSGSIAVISETLWRARFAADPAIAGRTVQLNGVPHTVVGVMPAEFQFPRGAGGAAPDIWVPIAEPIQLYRGRHFLWVVARLRDGVTVAQAQSEMDAIAGGIAKEMPQFSRGHGANVQPLHGEIVQQFRRAILLLFAGVGLVLLIACCNVANLLLARAAGRQQEIAVRIALGAGRLRVARQLLAEGAVLAALGGGAGVLVAIWLVSIARASFPADIPRLQNAGLDLEVLAFAAGISILTALVFGLVPLGQAMRVHVADRLKHGSKGVARPIRQPLRRALIVAEVALTMALATGAGLLLKSLNKLLHVDPGFRTQGITAVDLALPGARYRAPASQRAFFDEAIARIRALPDVEEVAATSLVPQGSGRSGIAIAVEGRPAPAPGEQLAASFRVVTPDYFKVLDIPLLAGRGFGAQDARLAVPLIRWFPQQPRPQGFDAPQAAPVAVINQSMARAVWPATDPIGRRFTVLFSPPITVVGVVGDSRNRALYEEAGAEFYLSHAQEPLSKMTVMMRSHGSGGALPAALRATIWSIDRDLPVSNVRALADVVESNLSLFRAIASLMGAFAVMALVLMTLGVYAVVSYTTAQRTYEIGVRIALGAPRREIRRLVVLNGIGLTAVGIALGLAGAYALARFASNMLYEVAPSDPFTYGALAALVLAIAMIATWGPARRAQRVDPVTVLRNE